MIVKFQLIGGFAPQFLGCRLDTAALPADEARELEGLVRTSGILQTEGRQLANLCDGQRLTFEIEADGVTHSATFDQATLPEAAQPLAQFLLARSGNLLDELRGAGE